MMIPYVDKFFWPFAKINPREINFKNSSAMLENWHGVIQEVHAFEFSQF